MAGDMFVVGIVYNLAIIEVSICMCMYMCIRIVYNLAIIEVSGRRCGRICMRMCMYDLSTPTYIHIICR